MANTIPILSLTNTFGDLLTQQNRQAVELNNLAANNYTKDTGTLFLNGSGTGLSVTAAALLGSGIVSGTLSVGGSISAVSNVFINGAGNGLEVANNSLLRGNVVTNNLSANNIIRANTFNAAGNVFANDITSNNVVRTSTLNAAGGAFVNTIVANTSINVPTITITSKLDANSAPTSFFNNLQTTGQVSVGGNFVINGTTVYSTNTFTLNAGSAIGQISSFNVNRGSSGANASIRWNEPQKYFDIVDVNNPTSYSKILTANLISSSLTSTSTDTFASSSAANTLNNSINTNLALVQGIDATQNTWISSNVAYFQGVDNTQNTSISIIQGVDNTQNTSISIIQGVDNTQNTWISSNVAYFQGVNNTQNTTITAAFDAANNRVSSVSGTAGRISSSGGLTPVIDLVNTGVTAKGYGTAGSVPTFVVGTDGRITSVSNTNIAIASGAVSGLAASATTDTTNASNIGSGTLNSARLPTSGVSVGTYGGSNTIPIITVDTYGRVTSAANTVSTFAQFAASGTIVEYSANITSDYTITAGKNALSTGPITINSGVTVTVPSTSRWVIL
jgi:hypothetical protein